MDAGRKLVLCCGLGLLGCGGYVSGGGEGASDASSESPDESPDETGDETGGEPPIPNEPPWAEPIDPCEGVTCSAHGTCVATGLVARCECEPGFLAKRHECITCTPLGVDRVYDVDVPVVTVQPQLTVAGQPYTDGFAYINLVSDSDTVRVMQTNEAPTPLSVIPGVYDLQFYRHQNPVDDDPLPDNNDVIFATGRTITADGELLIDIPVAEVTVGLHVNGEPPNHSRYNSDWYYAAVDRASEDKVEFEELDEFTYFVDLIPGVYDMRFSGVGQSQPDNAGVITQNNAYIAKSGHIVLDVPMIQQSGVLTVGGQVLGLRTLGWASDASAAFIHPELGQVSIGDPTVGGDYSARIMPGTYDILYERHEARPELPANEHAIILAGLTITTDGGTTNVDIPIVTRSGALTLNGATVAADEWGAELYYINRTTGDRVLIRDLAWGEYEIQLIPGVYDLLYDLYEPRPVLPSNDASLIATGIVVDQSGTFDIDVPMITVSGSVTVNGQIVGQPEEASIYFLQPGIGRVIAADVSAGSYSVKMIPGVYDVVYNLDTAYWEHPPGLPANRYGPLADQVEFDESGTFDVDVPAVEITGMLTIEGQPVAGGALWLNNPGSPSDMRIALSGSPYSALVLPGTYAVTYTRDSDGVGDLMIPQNTGAVLDCIIIE